MLLVHDVWCGPTVLQVSEGNATLFGSIRITSYDLVATLCKNGALVPGVHGLVVRPQARVLSIHVSILCGLCVLLRPRARQQ